MEEGAQIHEQISPVLWHTFHLLPFYFGLSHLSTYCGSPLTMSLTSAASPRPALLSGVCICFVLFRQIFEMGDKINNVGVAIKYGALPQNSIGSKGGGVDEIKERFNSIYLRAFDKVLHEEEGCLLEGTITVPTVPGAIEVLLQSHVQCTPLRSSGNHLLLGVHCRLH